MKRHSYKYFAALAATLATLFMLCGCLPDKEKAAARERERIQSQVIAANELLNAGQTDEAITQLEKLDKAHPNQLDILEALGFAYARQPDPLMASFYFDHAFELSPQQPDLALFAAQAHAESGQNEKAAQAYRAYLALTPGDIAAWRKLGETESQLQRNKPALDAYLQVLRLTPPPASSADLLRLARLYHALGNQAQAQYWYEEQLKQASPREERSAALLGLFDISLRQKQWPRSVELMLELETLDPQALSSGPYAQAYEELSNWHKAQQEALAKASGTATTAAPDTAAEQTTTGQQPATSEETGSTQEAIAQATTPEQAPSPEQQEAPETPAEATDAIALSPAAETATETGSTTESATAQAADTAAATTAGTAASATSNQTASTATSATSGTAAGTASGTAANAAPTGDSPQAPANAVTSAGQKQAEEQTDQASTTAGSNNTAATPAPDTALTAGTDTTTTDAATPSADATASAAAIARAAADGSVDSAEAAEQADPAVAEAAANAAELTRRGNEAFAKGDYAEAAELLERAVKINPSDSKVLDQLSRACFRSGSYQKAERYAALAMYAEPKNLTYRLEYLRAYQRNHPPADLLQQMISAKEDFPNEANVTLTLARGYEYIAQRKSLAAAIYHEYLEQAPDSPLAEDIRQKLLEWEM